MLIKQSSQNSIKILNLVKNNKNIFIKILSDVLNLKVDNIKHVYIEKFKDISEYEFSLSKLSVILANECKTTIHLKVVKRNKIKENIFCYWSLIYENELKKNKKFSKNKLMISKVTISDICKERYKNSVLLELQENPYKILKYGVELHFVDILKYSGNKNKEINNLLNIKEDELLLVGIILNKKIERCNIKL